MDDAHATADAEKPNVRKVGTVVSWAALGLFVIYPLSAVPVAITGAWLQHWGIVDFQPAFEVFYWPVERLLEDTEPGKRVVRFIEPPLSRVMPGPPGH
jgi:hypothetical protein